MGAITALTRAGRPDVPTADDDAGAWRERWRPALRSGLMIWLATHVAYLALGRLVLAVAPSARPHLGGAWWPVTTYFDFDSLHFQDIALHGAHRSDVAFFPGYPLLARGLAHVIAFGSPSSFQVAVALALIAWVGSAASAVLLWRLTADRHGPRAASAAVLVLLAGPYSVFFVAAYSEGMFLAFALGAWLCATRARWGWAGVLCALSMTVRVNAGFLLLGLLVMYVLDARRRQVRLLRPELAAVVLLPLAVLGAYFGWLRARTGTWTAWFHAQSVGWDRRTSAPWTTFARSLDRTHLGFLPPAVRFQSVLEIVFALVLVAGVVALAVRRRWPEAVYVAAGTVTLLSSTYYLSVPRSTLLAFPVIMGVGAWAVTTRHRVLVAALALVGVALAALNATTFVHGLWTD